MADEHGDELDPAPALSEEEAALVQRFFDGDAAALDEFLYLVTGVKVYPA